MAKPYVEAKVKGKEILRVDAPFDRALASLRRAGIRDSITAEELAYARIHASEGKQSSLMTNGSYTKAGFAYIKGENPIRVADSPLLKASLAKQATQANRKDRYHVTENQEMYETLAKMAEQDKNLAPQVRRVIVLPSRSVFPVSLSQNSDVFANIFGKSGKEYLAFLGFDKLNVYLVGKNTVDTQAGTILTQEWLAWLASASSVDGANGGLYYGSTVRGVRLATGEASSQKTEKISLPYTQKELDSVVKLLEGVRNGSLPSSKLERAIKFAGKLK